VDDEIEGSYCEEVTSCLIIYSTLKGDLIMGPDEQNACYEPSYSEEPTACYDDPEAAAREAQERAEAERRRVEEYDKPIESDALGNALVGGLVGGIGGFISHGPVAAAVEGVGHFVGDLLFHEVTHGGEESDSSSSQPFEGSGGAEGTSGYDHDGGTDESY
jgi:hypothetical protein